MKRLGLMLFPLALAACQPTYTTSPIMNPDACGASRLQGLVGQDAMAIQAFGLPRDTRIIRHSTMITQDYAPSRLNVYIDRREQIIEVSCG